MANAGLLFSSARISSRRLASIFSPHSRVRSVRRSSIPSPIRKMASDTKFILDDISFCPTCGSILPVLGPTGGVVCVVCKHVMNLECFEEYEVQYTIEFNAQSDYKEEKKLKSALSKSDGPLVDRKCPKCGNDTMSYASLQLRSADEGQTVFYTCTKCHFKETENS